jgi:hypothetical protein
MNRGTLRVASVDATMPCGGARTGATSSVLDVAEGAGAGAGSCGCDEHDKREPARGMLATSRARKERGRFGDRIVFLRERNASWRNDGVS